MAEQQAPVAAGTLSGINLSGDDEAPEATLPPEDERTAPEPEAAATVETDTETEPETAADGAGDGGDEPPPAPPATDEPDAAATDKPKAKAKGAPARPYVVLRQETFEDTDDPYFVKVHEVEARNAQNAMRRAFKDLSGDAETQATLVVIPASMFRPTQVSLTKTERVSVSFG